MVSYAVPPQFDEAVDKWPAYQIRLEAFFEGNGVTDGKKKRALLVAALSTNTVDVISGRCAPAKAVPAMAAGRIQRWALLLGAYNYVIQHKDGKANIPADALSRLPASGSAPPESAEDVDGCGKTPAMLLMGYELRSRLDNAVVPPPSRVNDRNDTYTNNPVHTGEPVWVRNFGRGELWTPARVQSTDGARMVTADGNEGDVLHRHLDQVKPRLPESPPESASSPSRLPPPEAAPGLQRPTRTRRAPVRFSP
ncbi:uncharacterized protein LOC121838174 [Ixodes scapularis]|uniref:uncharacterized protein LOC121838174 n=1 Tax=Ixodes scapularis TaxID=6945 RepID=UPI001C38E0BB|nr:uncharacterized protein LOC121838174 [Ixodes scapularis]